MRRFLLFPVLFSLSLAGVAGPALTKKHEKFSVLQGKVDVERVRSGAPALDAAVRKAEDDIVAGFRKNLVDLNKDGAKTPSPTLDITVGQEGSSPRFRCLMITASEDLNGAHPGYFSRMVAYDTQSRRVVQLRDLFQPGTPYLKKLSSYCTAALHKQGHATFPEGAGPKAANFDLFYFKPGKLVIYFDVYQVASYAEGPQIVEVPLAELQGLLAPGVR